MESDITSDHLHPNDKGHALLAEVVYFYLDKVYDECKENTYDKVCDAAWDNKTEPELPAPLTKNRYEACYGKSLKVRRVVAERFEALLKQYDAVLTPACSKGEFAAYSIDDAFVKVFEEGVFTAIPNLVGTPALVSGGVQLMGWHFAESTLLSLAGSVERMGE